MDERMQRRLASIKIIPYDAAYRSEVLLIAREMHQVSIYADMPFDDKRVIEQLSFCLNAVPTRYFKLAVRDGVVLGGLLGNVSSTFFCSDILAKDLAWMVTKDRRGDGAAIKLLSDFEDWARSRGASKIMIGQSTERDIEKTTKLYLHLGYRLTGFNTVKDL